MPNYCNYGMRIVGKKENVEELIKYMKADYDYTDSKNYCSEKHHLFRVFECDVNEDSINEEDGIYSCEAYGSCAWSIHSCMFDGEHTYYKRNIEEYGYNSRAITIQQASKELNLEIEIFSEEGGCGFMEHYIIKNGEILVNDCVEYSEEEDEETGEWTQIGGLEWDFAI